MTLLHFITVCVWILFPPPTFSGLCRIQPTGVCSSPTFFGTPKIAQKPWNVVEIRARTGKFWSRSDRGFPRRNPRGPPQLFVAQPTTGLCFSLGPPSRRSWMPFVEFPPKDRLVGTVHACMIELDRASLFLSVLACSRYLKTRPQKSASRTRFGMLWKIRPAANGWTVEPCCIWGWNGLMWEFIRNDGRSLKQSSNSWRRLSYASVLQVMEVKRPSRPFCPLPLGHSRDLTIKRERTWWKSALTCRWRKKVGNCRNNLHFPTERQTGTSYRSGRTLHLCALHNSTLFCSWF